ncbi:MAG TPA: hypothetical protein VMF56_07100 [Acidobacteriaceae bacterium]|nr:hypothetical protein [Acidobacteriaceae bacterium]
MSQWKRQQRFRGLLLAVTVMAWGMAAPMAMRAANPVAMQAKHAKAKAAGKHSSETSNIPSNNLTRSGLNGCQIYKVKSLPGSRQYASEFLETMAIDPRSRSSNEVWGLTADLDSKVPAQERAIYLSKSTNGGVTWTPIARLSQKYFNAKISEGLRNGLAVEPGGKDFVVTTQLGAFQVIPHGTMSSAVVRPIVGPRVPDTRPKIPIPKHAGQPVRAGVVLITADGKRMLIGYGYFDLTPQVYIYRRDKRGEWVEEGRFPRLPNDLDIFSMAFDDPTKAHPRSLYLGTGDQAYRLNLATMQWTRVTGVGPDSAIHGMSTVGGLHIAACWGVYNPVTPDEVARVTHARFLLHRMKDVVGPNIRAYGIEVDPLRPNREVLSAITGVYVSKDDGQDWRRLNDLPEGEFHTAHFNEDGTVILSGFAGTYIANPFSGACAPQLLRRGQ